MAAASRCQVGRGVADVLVHRGIHHRGRGRGRSRGSSRASTTRRPPNRRPARRGGPMTHLLRELAPVSDESWSQISNEATRTLKHFLTSRRLVDFSGPHGWEHEVAPRAHVEAVADAPAGVRARMRAVQPLVEYRVEFAIDRAQLEAIDRGARDADLDTVRDAARRLALAEDGAVF